MKTIHTTLSLGAALLFAATLTSSAQLVLNFDSDTAGDAPSMPSGVDFGAGGPGTALVSGAAYVSPFQSLDIACPDGISDSEDSGFFGPTVAADLVNPTLVSFNLLLPDATSDFFFAVGDSVGLPPDEVRLIAGEFYAFDGSTYTALGTYTSDTWYTVQLYLNPAAGTYTTDLVGPTGTIDGSSTLALTISAALNDLIFENAPTENTPTFTGTVNPRTVNDYVDDVKIVTIAPEPSSVSLAIIGAGLLLAFRLITRKRFSAQGGMGWGGFQGNL